MPKKRILIIGAGEAGEKVLKEIKKFPELGLLPIGFIDDDPEKQGKNVDGLKVLGTRRELAKILRDKAINEAYIALPSVHGEIIADYVQKLAENKVVFKIVPRVREIIEAKVNINRIREVQVEDLLGRPVIKTELKELSSFLKGKRILITGAAGSIGSEISRQIAAFKPKKLILLDWWETGTYNLQREFEKNYPQRDWVALIGNVQDKNKIRETIKTYKPEIIFHAAAYKHVPLMEENPVEAVKNNVFGTKIVADEAKKAQVPRFVLISTDKAVNPTSVMGASKLIAEGIIKSLNKTGRTKFMAVRFGNVLDSYGSVLPLFREQIAKGGPVTVTDPRMTRYFMTIPEAVQLILKAAAIGAGGEIFILDMGEPVKIFDFARNLIRLSGLVPDKEIKIKFTGIRKGEKLFEELLTKKEEVIATEKERIFITKNLGVDEKRLNVSLAKLANYAKLGKEKLILAEFKKLIPNFQHESF